MFGNIFPQDICNGIISYTNKKGQTYQFFQISDTKEISDIKVDNAISKHAQTTKDLEKVKIRKMNEERNIKEVLDFIENLIINQIHSIRYIYN